MKNLVVLLAFIFALLLPSISQDILIYKNGVEAKIKVTEITDSEVRFRRFDNLSGPLYTVFQSDVHKIIFENGTEQIFLAQVPIKIDKAKDQESDLGYERIHYNGPRVGMTMFQQGTTRTELESVGYAPVISQFGWQFETRIFTLSDGTSGLLEWVFLVGGVEKGLFLPSASMLIGIRGGKNGFEFGVGPNLSKVGFGMVFAVGGSLKYEKMYFPFNLAIVPSVIDQSYNASSTDNIPKTGVRVSLLVGFNTQVN